MDPRVREHASIIVEHATAVESDDDVIVRAPPVAENLVVALATELGERGAHPAFHMASSRAERSYLRAIDPDEMDVATHRISEIEAADVVISISSHKNTMTKSDIPPQAAAAKNCADRPVENERRETRWVVTQHPATGMHRRPK